ncbi:MAG TPA: DnaJ domain-containing protein [Vulgatibacter sp.]
MPVHLCDLSSGELGSASLASILIEALRTRATGELSIEAAGGNSRLYLRDGHPRGVQIFFGFKPLGQFLLELGWIDIQGLEKSLLAVAGGRKQGEALVELGFLGADQLSEGLGLLHRSHLRTLADLTEGTYAFESRSTLPAWTEGIRIPAHRAIVDALASHGGQATARRILDDVPTGGAIRLRSGWESYVSHFEPDEEELAFLRTMASPRPLSELLHSAAIGEERAAAVVAALLHMGVAISRAETTSGEPPGRSVGPVGGVPHAGAAGTSGMGTDAAGMSSGATGVPTADPSSRVSPGLSGAASGGVSPGPSAAPSSRVSPGPSDEASIRFSPDPSVAGSSISPGLSATASSVSPGPSAAASSRISPGPSADSTRHANPHPARSAGTGGTGAAPIPSTGPARYSIPGASPGPGARGGAGTPTDLERRIAALIEERHAAVAQGDHFAVLGLGRTAAPAEIKQAFLEAVKLLHPDRLPPSLSTHQRKARELFEAVTVANDVLSDLPKRKAWLAAWDKRHSSGEIRNPDVRQLATKGEQLLSQRRFGQALEFFKQALLMEDHPDLRAHAIWAANADPSRPNLERARRELRRIHELHPESAAAVAYLARLDEGV